MLEAVYVAVDDEHVPAVRFKTFLEPVDQRDASVLATCAPNCDKQVYLVNRFKAG